jgi:hypothetical protein
MVWLFALGVLVLAALNRGFRLIALSLLGLAVAAFGAIWLYAAAPAAVAIVGAMGAAFLIAKGFTSRGSSPSNIPPPESMEASHTDRLREYRPPPLLSGPEQRPPS